ncbi:lipopolysaccharide heptosyltransferase II [candidate division TA06 bacterium]|nr:lipopolysaccharide heptosyltransferase II [candidate division TA06 bacterium]
MKILLTRLSSIGDIVLATSLLKPLRENYPEGEIVMAVMSPYLPLLQGNPYLSRVIPFEKDGKHRGGLGLLRFILSLRRERFDLAIDLHRNLRSHLITLFAGAERSMSYQKEIIKRRAMVFLKKRRKGKHTVHRYLKALDPLGVSLDHAGPGLYLSKEERAWAERYLEECKILNYEYRTPNFELRSPIIGIVPGAKHSTKRWNPPGFALLGDRLTKELNATVVLLGDGNDEEVAREIEERMEEEVNNFVGKTSLRELAALLDQCHLVVTNDSGPLHMATALGRPVVALFGPTVEEFGFTPYDNQSSEFEVRSIVLSKDLSCRPCSLHGSHHCPLGHHNCMNFITSDEVFGAVKKILSTTRNE